MTSSEEKAAPTGEAKADETKADEASASADKPSAPSSSNGRPALEPGVCGCFSVVSGAVRKGKGRGKGKSNANGGYVPAHLRDPSDEAAAAEAAPEASTEELGGATGSTDASTGIAEATSADTTTTATDAGVASSVAAGLSGGASFDSLGLSTSGSFDETGEGGTSMRKRAKRWQRRGSASATDVTAAAAATAASASQAAEPEAKRLKASPPGSPAETPGTTDVPAQGTAVKPDVPDFGDLPMPSPEASPVADDAGMPPPSPAVDAFPPPSPFPQGQGPATLAKLSVGKLKTLARYHGVSIAGCLEKAEMVAALRKAGVDDAAAEKMEERARGGAAGESQSAPKDTKTPLEKENERKAAEHAQKRAQAKISDAEQRAAAAEAEAQKLRDQLNATKTSSKKKWAPAFQSTPFIPGQEKDMDAGLPPRSPMGGHFGGPGSAGGGAPRAPTGGVDLRQNGMFGGGKGGQKGGGGPGFDICWEFKKGMCNKGPACKWKHS